MTLPNIKPACFYCGSEKINAEMPDWIKVSEVDAFGVRSFQADNEYKYETFHLPNKQTKLYCSKPCAVESFKKSLDLFLAEIMNKTRRSSDFRPL